MSRIDEALKRLARRDVAPGGPSGETAAEAGGSNLDRYPVEQPLKWTEPPLVEVSTPPRLPSARVIRAAPAPEPLRAPAGLQAEPRAVPSREVAVARATPAPEAVIRIDTRHIGDAGSQAADSEKLVDFQQIAEYVGFVLRSVLRHKALTAAIFILMMSTTIAGVLVWPKTYQVQTKLLAQRNEVMAALVNPGRTIPRDADAPIRAAADTVLRRENLIALMKRTDLLADWDRTRPFALRMKDKVFAYVKGAPTEQERFDGLVGLLEKQLTVMAGSEGTVTINIDWPDPRMGFELATAALDSYLEAQRLVETSTISDSISILERTSESLQEQVNRTIVELESQQQGKLAASRARTVARVTPPQPAPAPAQLAASANQPSPETLLKLARLKASMEAKRQDIGRLDGLRRQQLQDANTKLSTALTIYTEGHPAIATLRQSVDSLSTESPELTNLRIEEQNLEAQYDAAVSQPETTRSGPSSEAAAAAFLSGSASALPVTDNSISLANMGPDYVNPTSLRLRVELTELATIRERTNSARAELATSQASFKYRYSIVRPPRMPNGPIKPNVLAVVLAGLIGSVMLAFAAALALDLFGGRIIESWQVQRLGGIPVLGTLEQP